MAVFSGPITGRKFFVIFASFFVVIIGVNIALAVSAARTFPGLEVKNSYVASQQFDVQRAAQEALGWTIDARVQQGELHLTITDANGAPVEVQSVSGTFGRATSVRDDQTPDFMFDGQMYRAPVTTAPGNWNLRFEAIAEDGTLFRQRVVVIVES
ncbi:nitrogen fixation protein FixH [Loktanella sp. IMCC34160]|uniref:FixH family protein n=1 Tax=Loktanella sp. IMCC34160 TaxID=2510646 RepID=UPI00101D3B2E|nr:FixH family protein [Loktanella sp. IMCC34160]RYG92697.1 nitrogen fixation protein FixH [Loktanella sp. IMCC34160]